MIVTSDLIDSMISIEIANLRSRVEGYATRPGNPTGVYVEQFGVATAFVAENIPVRLFNSVLGFGPDTIDHLDQIGEFYADHGVSEAIEIVPGRMSEAEGIELWRRGFAAVEFHTGFARELGGYAPRPPRPGILVEAIDAADPVALDRFIATDIEGWGGDPTDPDGLANLRTWKRNETWQMFLASIDGEPVGAGVLDIRSDGAGEIALLAAGSTLPSARGRGVQAALIEARLAAALEAGCTRAIAGSYFGNSSMGNLGRAGFSMAFVRAIWVRITR